MWTFLVKSVVKIRTCILYNLFFFNHAVFERMSKIWYSGQITDYSVMLGKQDAIFLPDNYGTTTDTHTLRTCNICCFSTAKVVTRTRIIVTSYLYYMSGWVQKLFKFLAATNRLTSTYHTGSLVCINSTAASAYANCSNGQVTQFYESPRIKLKEKKTWSHATQLTWNRNKNCIGKSILEV